MEKNRETLRRALDQLPSYNAPTCNWEAINSELDQVKTTPLAEQLPAYSPPPMVWNAINRELELPVSTPVRSIWRRLVLWRAVAAVWIGVVVATFIWLQEPAPKVTVSYGQEAVVPVQVNVNWDEEEPQFESILAQLQSVASSSPRLNDLRLELEELNAAKQEITTMLTAYGGKDPDLINQLGDIERERSAVYRELIKQI